MRLKATAGGYQDSTEAGLADDAASGADQPANAFS